MSEISERDFGRLEAEVRALKEVFISGFSQPGLVLMDAKKVGEVLRLQGVNSTNIK